MALFGKLSIVRAEQGIPTMWIVKVLSFGMFVGLVLATIDADLEEDNFRTLKAGGNVGEEVETAKDDAETVDDEEASNDGGEVADDESKQFFETGETNFVCFTLQKLPHYFF